MLIAVLMACDNNNKQKYPYAIRDFDKSLQPYLIELVTKGILGRVDSVTSYIQKKTSIAELKKLTLSEHPILRVVAVLGLLNRKEVDPFEILMSHLDDTALITTGGGEFGYSLEKVSEVIIRSGTWASAAQRQITIDKIIAEHNYLRSAYSKVASLEPLEKYYSHVKKMAGAKRQENEDIENALYALAKYKKKEDVLFIKDQFKQWHVHPEATSFQLMREYPQEVYFEFLQSHFDYYLNFMPHLRFRIYWNQFFETVSVYKNKEAAAMLAKGLEWLNDEGLHPQDISRYKETIIYAIWNNECDAYKELRKKITPEYLAMEKKKAGYGKIKVIKHPPTDPKVDWWD